jgi:hypothetical protein
MQDVGLDGTLAFLNADKNWKPNKGFYIRKPFPKVVKFFAPKTDTFQ